MKFTYKSQEAIDAMTPVEADAYQTEKREFEANATKEAIAQAVKEAKDALEVEVKAAKENVEQLALKVTELESKGSSKKQETMIDVIKANREKIDKSTRSKGDGQMTEFVVKADTLRANVLNNGYAQDLTDVGQYATRKLTVYDLFPKVPVAPNSNGVVRYVDWDTATMVRAAAAVAEGIVIPEATAKWATYTLALQKVGVTIPVSEEFTYDDQMFITEVENFLRNDVAYKIDTDLISANGTAPNIKGLLAQSTAYTAVASGISDASIYDLIVDVKRSITSAYGSKYAPDFALMNITDINKMLLKKDVNKQYVAPPFSQNSNGVGEFVVAGIRVIECNSVPANQMVLGDSRYAKIYEEPGFVVGTGYDGNDWSYDMMTLKARKRLNLLVRTVDQTGFAKVASISAALTTLAT
jgi:hypothetical protein